jgi:hypothetical protein
MRAIWRSEPMVAVCLDGEGRVITALLLSPNRRVPSVRHAYLVVGLPVSRAELVNPGDLVEIGAEGQGRRVSQRHRG